MMLNNGALVSRTDVMEAVCPECLAAPGASCHGALRADGSRRERTRLHLERWAAYQEMKTAQGQKITHGEPTRERQQAPRKRRLEPTAVLPTRGGMSDEEFRVYLTSPEWKKRQSEALQARNKCLACDTTKDVRAFHLSYENVGDEPQSDLAVLCLKCGHGARNWHDRKGGSLRKATQTFIWAYKKRAKTSGKAVANR